MSPDPAPAAKQPAANIPAALAALPPVASAATIAIGFLVLLGWQLDIEILKRIAPGFVAMNPPTALLFVLAGSALPLIIYFRSSAAILIARGLAALIITASLSEIIEAAGLIHSPVDEFLFRAKLWDPQQQLMNRMAPTTALNFVLAGSALLMLDVRGRSSISQALAIVIGFGAILPLAGYAYGARTFSGLAEFIPMALHTAATFVLLAGGILFAVPHAPLIEPFATTDPRGVLARRLLPLVIILILFLGWVCVWGVRHELFDSTFGIALYALSLVVLFAVILCWTAATVGGLEVERAALNARLHEVNRRKDEMIAVVSHDLCSPLTGFRMVIDLLREGKEGPSEELLGIMDQSARRMVSMVRGLLDISKLQADKFELELEELRVSEVIKEAMEPLVINANAKHIQMNLTSAPEEPVITADRLRVSQIFSNLLTNAVKFTSSGGKVDVSVRSNGEGVRVEVSDTGLGIPKEEMAFIFDKYHQTRTRATAGETGAGLGLAIVRELVLLHGGQITVLSEVNRGTAFTVLLPVKPARPSESTLDARAS